jgi:hypothetical protein
MMITMKHSTYNYSTLTDYLPVDYDNQLVGNMRCPYVC